MCALQKAFAVLIHRWHRSGAAFFGMQVEMHSQIPGSQLLLVLGAGHGLEEQNPLKLADAMIQFLA